jgi:hypothetical protein
MTTHHGSRLNGTNDGSPLGGPTEVGPLLGDPTEENRCPLLGAVSSSPKQSGTTGHGSWLNGGPKDMTGSPTLTTRRGHRGHCPIQPPHPIQPCIMKTRHGPRLDGTNEGPPLGGPAEVGPLLRGQTEENRRPLLGAVALSPTQWGTTGHGPWLNGGPTEVGPPLGGQMEENRLLLGAVASSPMRSGTTGPSPTRLVTTGSFQHTGPTNAMTTHHGYGTVVQRMMVRWMMVHGTVVQRRMVRRMMV